MSQSILIENAQVITPAAHFPKGWLLARDKKIALIGVGDPPALEADETIDAGGLTLLPGFIDVHVHGSMGHEILCPKWRWWMQTGPIVLSHRSSSRCSDNCLQHRNNVMTDAFLLELLTHF